MGHEPETHQHLKGARGLLPRCCPHHGTVRPAIVVHTLPDALDEEGPLLPRVVLVGVVPAWAHARDANGEGIVRGGIE